jgi:hypothetical protein
VTEVLMAKYNENRVHFKGLHASASNQNFRSERGPYNVKRLSLFCRTGRFWVIYKLGIILELILFF